MANKNPPNTGGKGPSKSSQAKGKGPITGNRSSMVGATRPWTFKQGSNGSPKAKVAPKSVGSSPSKSKGGWYLGSKKGGPPSHTANPG